MKIRETVALKAEIYIWDTLHGGRSLLSVVPAESLLSLALALVDHPERLIDRHGMDFLGKVTESTSIERLLTVS